MKLDLDGATLKLPASAMKRSGPRIAAEAAAARRAEAAAARAEWKMHGEEVSPLQLFLFSL